MTNQQNDVFATNQNGLYFHIKGVSEFSPEILSNQNCLLFSSLDEMLEQTAKKLEMTADDLRFISNSLDVAS